MSDPLRSLTGYRIMTAMLAIEAPLSVRELEDYIYECGHGTGTTIRQTLRLMENQGAVKCNRAYRPQTFSVSSRAVVRRFRSGIRDDDKRHGSSYLADLNDLLRDIGSSWAEKDKKR